MTTVRWSARMFVLIGALAVLIWGIVAAAVAAKLVPAPPPLDVAHPVLAPERPGVFVHAWAIVFAIGAPIVGAAAFRLVRIGMVVRVDARGAWAGALGGARLVPWDEITGTWLLERQVASSMTFDRVRYFGATGGRVRISRLLQANADELIGAIDDHLRYG